MYPYFEIFGKTVGSYAVCSFIGLFAASLVAWRLSKRIRVSFEDIIIIVLVVVGGMLIGGHLLYAITNYDKIISCVTIIVQKIKNDSLLFSHIISAIQICFGGMVFYGGFIGSVTALYMYTKVIKFDFRNNITDIFAVCVPLFHAFGRIGCFLGGCCYGVESKFGFIADNELVPEMSGVRRFPISLVEALFNLLLFAFVLFLYNRNIQKSKLIFVYMIIYSIGRFVFEFFRGDEIRGVFFGLSTSQWISILFLVIGIYVELKEVFSLKSAVKTVNKD